MSPSLQLRTSLLLPQRRMTRLLVGLTTVLAFACAVRATEPPRVRVSISPLLGTLDYKMAVWNRLPAAVAW